MANQFTIKWNSNKARQGVDEGSVSGLIDAAEYLLDQALKLVPIDEGTLANSGNTSVDKNTKTASVYFDTSYAVRVHEDTTIRHKNGRRAKYVETPFKANQTKIQEILARSINNKIGDK